MTKLTTEEPENDEGLILSAIENMAFFLFSVLSDCYPEIATSELEDVFNEEFKTDVVAFVKNYRNNIGNRVSISGKQLAQTYSNHRFFEKLSKALEECKKSRSAGTIENKGRPVITDLPMR